MEKIPHGALVKGMTRHDIRIHPVQVRDHEPDENPNRGRLAIANRPPGAPWEFAAKDITDAGLLELVRYGIRRQTIEDTASAPTLLGIEFVDLPVAASRTAPIRFTFFWPANGRCEGRDYEVSVTQ
ncbi:MAG: hypothetical protein HYX76_04740 [Acidobacteria bacterium]|nr:hypothetical protein [Acidobacteriota bacterium]